MPGARTPTSPAISYATANTPINKIQALVTLGWLRARRGDPSATVLLDQARDLALGTGELQRIAPVMAARAEAAWLRADIAQCEREARIGYELATAHVNPWALGHLAFWLWWVGALAEPPADVAAPFALQMVEDWRAATAAWEQIGCPYEQGLALLDGDVSAQRHALDIFERLGARPAADMVRTLLILLGGCGVATTGAIPPHSTATQIGNTQAGTLEAAGVPSYGIGPYPPSTQEVANSLTVAGSSSGAVTTSTVSATCPTDDLALGGGWSVPEQGARVYAAALTGNTWTVTVGHQPVLTTITAYVECLNLGGPSRSGPANAVVTPYSSTYSIPPTTATVYNSVASCQAGVPVGFGFNLGADAANLELHQIWPEVTYGALWVFEVANHDSTPQTITVTAECLTVDGPGSMSVMGAVAPDEYNIGAPEVVSADCPSGAIVAGGGFSYQQGNFPIVGNLYLLHATSGGWQGSASVPPKGRFGIIAYISSPTVYAACLTFS